MESAKAPWSYFALTGLDGVAGYTRGDAPGFDNAALQAFAPVWDAHNGLIPMAVTMGYAETPALPAEND
jgi:hypothetical protein